MQESACTLSCVSATLLWTNRSSQVCADQRGVGLISDLCHRRLSGRRGEQVDRRDFLTHSHSQVSTNATGYVYISSYCLIKTQRSLKQCISPASFYAKFKMNAFNDEKGQSFNSSGQTLRKERRVRAQYVLWESLSYYHPRNWCNICSMTELESVLCLLRSVSCDSHLESWRLQNS